MKLRMEKNFRGLGWNPQPPDKCADGGKEKLSSLCHAPCTVATNLWPCATTKHPIPTTISDPWECISIRVIMLLLHSQSWATRISYLKFTLQRLVSAVWQRSSSFPTRAESGFCTGSKAQAQLLGLSLDSNRVPTQAYILKTILAVFSLGSCLRG